MVGERTGPEGERGGKIGRKGGKGPESTLEKAKASLNILVMFSFLCPSNNFRQNFAPKIRHSRHASTPHLLGKRTSKGRCSTRPSPRKPLILVPLL